jgi:hypothetical protein
LRKERAGKKPTLLALSMVTAKVATVTTPSATATTEVQADARSVPIPIVAVVVVRRISIAASADEMAMPVPAAPVIYVIDGRRFGGSRLQPTGRRSGAGRNCEAAEHQSRSAREQ